MTTSASRTITPSGRTLRGMVVSDKMSKTVVVKVTRLRKHAKYKKFFRVSKKFKAHDEANEYRVGDAVAIRETRPLSKDKRWIVVERLTAAPVELADSETTAE